MTDISVAAAIADDEHGEVEDDDGKSVNGEHGDVEDDGGKNIGGEDGDFKDVDDEEGISEVNDVDSSGLSVEQQTISSGSVICEDLSIVEVESSAFFFLKDERKNESIVPRFGSLSSGCILTITVSILTSITIFFV
jgi:hypothetical protein